MNNQSTNKKTNQGGQTNSTQNEAKPTNDKGTNLKNDHSSN